MTHSTRHLFFERRQTLRDLAADVAEHAAFLLGGDRSLTHEQRQTLSRLMADAWAVRDSLEASK